MISLSTFAPSRVHHHWLRSPRQVSLLLAIIACACLWPADLAVVSANPWHELRHFGWGLLHPEVWSWSQLAISLATTLAFALQGIALAALLGFILALLYRHLWVRATCAFLRAIHELFWALIFIQLFGLTTLTGLLAIGLPFAGTLAKIYGELLEESDKAPQGNLLAPHSLSGFFYTSLPLVWSNLCSYTRYRFECAIRASVVLGFIGLPTLGFELESDLREGHYANAAAILYLLIGLTFCLRWLLRGPLIPAYLIAAALFLPPQGQFSWPLLQRFFSQDIIPAPLLRGGQWPELLDWLQSLCQQQLLPGLWDTLVLSQIALLCSGLLALCCFPLNSSLFLSRGARRLGDGLLIVVRTLPEYLLAFIGLLFLGPSMLPAIIALSLHNGAIIAHLLGLYSDQLPRRDDVCSGLNRYGYEVLPRLYRQFLALLLYRWEVILRETAILGILGIGTLGFYIDSAFEEFRFDRALVLILASALLNMLADALARQLRQRLHIRDSPALASSQ